MSSFLETHQPKLVSLGFAFYGEAGPLAADPEKTLLEILPSFFEDRKVFCMLLTWLEVVSDLVHVERLKVLSQGLSPEHKALLAVVALKRQKADRRWSAIYRTVRRAAGKAKLIAPPEYAAPYLLSKYGKDVECAKLGIETASVLPEDRKKILSLEGILQINPWLRLRAIIGPTFRADIAYLYLSKQATGPVDAARRLGCARDTAYRNWRAIVAADIGSLLKIAR